MIDIICEIVLCFFAIFGFLDIIKFIINRFSLKQIRGKYSILIDSDFDSKNFDFLIRYLESAIITNNFESVITNIVVSKNVNVDENTYSLLSKEFGNIFRD